MEQSSKKSTISWSTIISYGIGGVLINMTLMSQ